MVTAIARDEGPVTDRVVPGPALHFHSVMPTPGPARAVVGMLHGYADHGARYAHVMDAWAGEGLGSVALDFRGHGRADGARGHCARFDEYLDDVTELARLVSDRARGAPAFLFAHSFGALVAASSLQSAAAAAAPPQVPAWRGVVLSAPYLRLALPVRPLKRVVGRATSRILPRLAVPMDMHGADVTRAAVRARAYDEDPRIFHSATVRWFSETNTAQERALARASSVTSPLYVLFGTADRVAKIEAGRAFFDAAGSSDKTWDARPGFFHEILNDPGWETVAADIAKWILARA